MCGKSLLPPLPLLLRLLASARPHRPATPHPVAGLAVTVSPARRGTWAIVALPMTQSNAKPSVTMHGYLPLGRLPRVDG